ncbi:MAG TPA: hypothetical protein VLV16_03250 [Gemmatimonadales bacterium]|nr:hypothetical protein [Gemmatimonadales bacterium]
MRMCWVALLMLAAPLAAQEPDLTASKAERDSILADYHQIFPIWGRKALERGIHLPLPLGFNIGYYHMTQDIEISNLGVGFNKPPQPVDFITFQRANAELSLINLRVDLWVLPFLNVYGVVGSGSGHTTVQIAEPVAFTTTADFDGANAGLGLTGVYGVKNYFGVADFNHQWGFSSLLAAPVPANIFSMRLGRRFRVGEARKQQRATLWVGAMYQVLKSETNGSIKLSDVLPSGTDSLFNDYQNSPWYMGLNKAQQALVDEFVQRIQGGLDTTTVNYSLDKKTADPWNMLIGGTLDVGPHWGIRWEFGLIGRKSVFLMGNYRIRI